MPTQQTFIQFSSVQQLWGFAQRIKAVNIEINTERKTLLCDCSAADLALLEQYEGSLVDLSVFRAISSGGSEARS